MRTISGITRISAETGEKLWEVNIGGNPVSLLRPPAEAEDAVDNRQPRSSSVQKKA